MIGKDKSDGRIPRMPKRCLYLQTCIHSAFFFFFFFFCSMATSTSAKNWMNRVKVYSLCKYIKKLRRSLALMSIVYFDFETIRTTALFIIYVIIMYSGIGIFHDRLTFRLSARFCFVFNFLCDAIYGDERCRKCIQMSWKRKRNRGFLHCALIGVSRLATLQCNWSLCRFSTFN